MNPNQTPETNEVSAFELTSDSAFKKHFCHVTPLSKYLAMALFVLLPFVGAYLGYQFAPEKVVEVERVVEIEKIAEVEKEIEIDEGRALENLISCYDSKDYYLIQSRIDPTDEYITSYIVKNKNNYPDNYFYDCLSVYKTVAEEDIILETQGPVYLHSVANNRLYFDTGTDKIRIFDVYDLDKESYVLNDHAWNLDEMETSDDYVRYWSLPQHAHSPDTEFTGACLGVEDYIFYGEMEYVEHNFETGDRTILDEKCI